MARSRKLRVRLLPRLTVAAVAAGVAVPAPASSSGSGSGSGSGDDPPAAIAYICVNPASGASWRIVIDAGRTTVDAHPANMGRAEISWFDPTDSSYNTLNRTTGDLTASIASSTGGYFRYAHCQPHPAR